MNTDVWTRLNDLPFGARWRASATATDSLGYLAFGSDDSLRFSSTLHAYNPTSDSWTFISNFPNGGRNYVNINEW